MQSGATVASVLKIPGAMAVCMFALNTLCLPLLLPYCPVCDCVQPVAEDPSGFHNLCYGPSLKAFKKNLPPTRETELQTRGRDVLRQVRGRSTVEGVDSCVDTKGAVLTAWAGRRPGMSAAVPAACGMSVVKLSRWCCRQRTLLPGLPAAAPAGTFAALYSRPCPTCCVLTCCPDVCPARSCSRPPAASPTSSCWCRCWC